MTAKRKSRSLTPEPLKKVTINFYLAERRDNPDQNACRVKPVVAMNALDQSANVGALPWR